jgi:hypothetical protein
LDVPPGRGSGRDLLARDWDVVEELARRRLLMIDD